MANNHNQTFDSEGRITPVQSRLNSSYAELYYNEMLDDTRIEPFDIPDDTGAIIFLTYILQQNTGFAYYMNILLLRQI